MQRLPCPPLHQRPPGALPCLQCRSLPVSLGWGPYDRPFPGAPASPLPPPDQDCLCPQVLIPLFTGQPLPPEKLQEVLAGLRASLQQLEETFLQDKPFLAGNEISLADLVAIVELMQVRLWPRGAAPQAGHKGSPPGSR